MDKTQVILLAIFAIIVVVAIFKGASISMRVKNWFSIDSKKPGTVDVAREIDISDGQIGEVIGIKGSAGGRDVSTVTVLHGGIARGAKIDRMVGIEEAGGGGVKKPEEP
jgi:hypothetical protein